MGVHIGASKILEQTAGAFIMNSGSFGAHRSLMMNLLQNGKNSRSAIICDIQSGTDRIKNIRGLLIPNQNVSFGSGAPAALDEVMPEAIPNFFDAGKNIAWCKGFVLISAPILEEQGIDKDVYDLAKEKEAQGQKTIMFYHMEQLKSHAGRSTQSENPLYGDSSGFLRTGDEDSDMTFLVDLSGFAAEPSLEMIMAQADEGDIDLLSKALDQARETNRWVGFQTTGGQSLYVADESLLVQQNPKADRLKTQGELSNVFALSGGTRSGGPQCIRVAHEGLGHFFVTDNAMAAQHSNVAQMALEQSEETFNFGA